MKEIRIQLSIYHSNNQKYKQATLTFIEKKIQLVSKKFVKIMPDILTKKYQLTCHLNKTLCKQEEIELYLN